MSGASRQLLPDGFLKIYGFVLCGLAIALASLPAQAQQKPAATNSLVTEQPKGKAFRTPADASAALYAAARRNDEMELMAIFGPDGKDLVEWSNDPKLREAQRGEFADKYDQMHRLVKEPDDTVALYVGAENWPMPVPIVEYKGKWYFDPHFGKQEILYRRVGRNEMEALQVCRALLDAEKEYYSEAHSYTANFMSSSASHDGLYWPASDSAQKSPIGPFLAHAGVTGPNSSGLEPYHGYYYRILLSQNAANGGFAVLAFPAEYRSSGVMTFVVEQNGSASEKDLGPNTADQAKQLTSATADSSWKKVE